MQEFVKSEQLDALELSLNIAGVEQARVAVWRMYDG